MDLVKVTEKYFKISVTSGFWGLQRRNRYMENQKLIELKERLRECLKPFLELFRNAVKGKSRDEAEKLAKEFANALIQKAICKHLFDQNQDLYEGLVHSLFEELLLTQES